MNIARHLRAYRVPLAILPRRSLASSPQKFDPVIDFETFEQIRHDKSASLVDVRQPSELLLIGSIPGAMNVPLNEVKLALDLPPDTFESIYRHPKPDKGDPIVFFCRSGKRAGTAVNRADELGFKNLSNYEGSWLDWKEKKHGA